MTTKKSTLPKGVTWEEIEILLNREENKTRFESISNKTFKSMLDAENHSSIVEIVLKMLKKRDLQNATREYAEQVVNAMHELAKTTLEQRSKV